MKPLGVLACLPFILSLLPTLGAQSDPRPERMAALVRHCSDQGMFNGALLVLDDSRTIYEAAAGVLDLKTKRAVTLDTPFYLASVGKQFTAMAVLLLVDEGKLSLEDEARKHLKELGAWADGVTLHHLLSHTSGIPCHFNDLRHDPKGIRNEDVLRILAEHGKLRFAPGTRWSYSNAGYVFLSIIVERVSGRPFGAFLRERIFEPLGMKNAMVPDGKAPLPKGRARGFGLMGESADYESFTTGSGGIYASVRDLAAWNRALIKGELLAAKTFEKMITPVAVPGGNSSGYGYGWMRITRSPQRVIYHPGGLAGFKTVNLINLDEGQAIIALSNCSDSLSDSMGSGLRRILMGAEVPDPKTRIGPYLAKLLRERGLDAAKTRYAEILEKERAPYDLGEGELNALGYSCLRVDKREEAVALFRLNVAAHPKSANVYDSLGEGLMAQGKIEEAIRQYARSLTIDPRNVNAIEKLQALKERLGVR